MTLKLNLVKEGGDATVSLNDMEEGQVFLDYEKYLGVKVAVGNGFGVLNLETFRVHEFTHDDLTIVRGIPIKAELKAIIPGSEWKGTGGNR